MYVELRSLKGLGARGPLAAEHRHLLWLPRGVVVSCMSSLDAYVHATLYDRIPVILAGPPSGVLPALRELVLEVFTVKKEDQVTAALEYVKSADGVAKLFERLRSDVLVYRSYQAPDKVVQAFKYLGFENVLQVVSEAWQGPRSSRSEIAARLSRYVRRRDQIAHEGDLEYTSHTPRPMTPDYARDCISFTKGFVERLNGVVYG
jgi:hypothetical protein